MENSHIGQFFFFVCVRKVYYFWCVKNPTTSDHGGFGRVWISVFMDSDTIFQRMILLSCSVAVKLVFLFFFFFFVVVVFSFFGEHRWPWPAKNTPFCQTFAFCPVSFRVSQEGASEEELTSLRDEWLEVRNGSKSRRLPIVKKTSRRSKTPSMR